jgi:hypothetical protein
MLVVFFPAQSQVKVCLNQETVKWYMEESDLVEIYKDKDSITQIFLTNQWLIITQADLEVESLERSVALQDSTIELQRKIIRTKEDQNSSLRKEIRKQRLQKALIALGSGVLIILILL